MRKLLLSAAIVAIATIAAIVCAYPAAVRAEESAPSASRVNITVVMPNTGASSSAETAAGAATANATSPVPVTIDTLANAPAQSLYPADVDEIRDTNGRRIVKVYELNAGENPTYISREPFTRDGWRYELADITRAESSFADSREHTETVTLNTDTKDTNAILSQIAPTLEFESDDGYVGILALNVASIKVEQAGTKTNSYTVSATREYPRLSAADTSLVPKTVTENGKTLSLAKVEWRAGNTANVDYNDMPEYYTAVATYTGTASKTVVTGYVTTAEYSGTVGKINQGRTVYTAYFLGTEIKPERTPPEVVGNAPAVESTTNAGADTGSIIGTAAKAGENTDAAAEMQTGAPPESQSETGAVVPTGAPLETAVDMPAETPADTQIETSATTSTETPEAVPPPATAAAPRAVSPLPLVATTAIIVLAVGGGAYLLLAKFNRKKDDVHETTD